MKKAAFFIVFLTAWLALSAQTAPDWLEGDWRKMMYPDTNFFTGFSEYIVEQGKTIQQCTEQAKMQAQADLVGQIRLNIQSQTQSKTVAQTVNGHYNEAESFANQTATQTTAEIVGMNTETYFDRQEKTVYAFTYVNKHELIGYYKVHLSLHLQQAESIIKTAEQLEIAGEKAKARKQCEDILSLLEKIRSIQDVLIALNGTANTTTLKVPETGQMRQNITQMQARLAQAVYLYVESNESLFGQRVDITTNKLKGELTVNGCSFVDNVSEADFVLKINVTTRNVEGNSDFVFCYADTIVSLFDTRKQKTVYSDSISEKSGSNSQDKAARKAMENVATKIVEKLKTWIN
ncbi:MAG: hypothetical protein LBS69_11095 [Prevotellaceae bacterium]|jgi:hypothetical protein|nr:hypothetical protein [Prevotellaceae bacterium]